MSGREIIAVELLRATGYPGPTPELFRAPFAERSKLGVCWLQADIAVQALTAAGYRILAPGEVDAETVEACARECDRIDNECGMEAGLAASCATAIRAIRHSGLELTRTTPPSNHAQRLTGPRHDQS